MRLGFFLENIQKDYTREDFFKSLDIAEQMGINYFQMFMGGQVINKDMSKKDINYIKSLLKDKNLQIVAFAPSHGHNVFFYPEENKEIIDTFKREMELAKEFGVSVFGGHLGLIFKDKNSTFYKNYYRTYKELADFAESINSCFTIETGPDDSLTLKDFLDEVDSNGAGVNFDTANILRIQDEKPQESIRILNRHIKLVHAKDGTCFKKSNAEACYIPDILNIDSQGGGYSEENPIGKGNVNWKETIQELKAINYDGDIIIERESGLTKVKDILAGKEIISNLVKEIY